MVLVASISARFRMERCQNDASEDSLLIDKNAVTSFLVQKVGT
jgi:hypothetical protein